MTNIFAGNPITLKVSGLPGKLTAADKSFLDDKSSLAATSASLAESVSGPTYGSTAAGLAATTSGDFFAVGNGDGTVTIYLNSGGTAVAQRTLATTQALALGTGVDKVGYQQPEAGSITLLLGEKARKLTVLPEEFDAVGDQTADDTGAIASAIAAASARGTQAEVYLTGNYLVTALSNPNGVVIRGPGKIVKAITGGVQQLSSYADIPGRIVFGREYIHRVFDRIEFGQSGASGQVGINLHGDSTVAGGYMTMPTADLLKRLFQTRGIGNVSITNYGVAGSSVSAMDAVSHLGPTTDLLIIKYGINDGTAPGSTRLATFQTSFDAKLAAIRADANGGVANLSIVLAGPNATGDTPNGRDERWYEQLRGIYVSLARKYQCCFIDTYGAFRDPRGGAGLWLTDDFGDGRGIHPRDSLGLKIWGLVVDSIISPPEAAWFGSSNFVNVTATSMAPLNGSHPSEWPMGTVHARATTGNGWPVDGFVISQRNPDGGCIQFLYPYAPNNSRVLIRTANISGDTFNRWTGAPEGLTLQNGWSDYGSGFPVPSAFMDTSGVVHLRGMITGGTTAPGTVIASLPAGMAPPSSEIIEVGGNAGRVLIKVQSNGSIVLQSTGDATFTSLSGVSFLAA